MNIYQYTMIKYIHNEASGECVNVGLAMYAPKQRLFRVQFNPRYSRVGNFFLNAFDGEHYRNMTKSLNEAFDHISASVRNGDLGSSGTSDPTCLFRELMTLVLPEDSTAFRWGPTFGGVALNPSKRFDSLFSEFVTRHDKPTNRQLRQESQIWSDFERLLKQRRLNDTIHPYLIKSELYEYEFRGSFLNSKPNVIEPISLDLQAGSSIIEKANQWAGRLIALTRNQDFAFHAILAPPVDARLRPYFDRACQLLSVQKGVVKHLIVEKEDQRQLDDLFEEIDAAKHH